MSGNPAFYVTQVTVTVLSEAPVPDACDLVALQAARDNGTYVLDVTDGPSIAVPGTDMAWRMTAAGADPALFGLDADGTRADR